jgi:hypothetical protein
LIMKGFMQDTSRGCYDCTKRHIEEVAKVCFDGRRIKRFIEKIETYRYVRLANVCVSTDVSV